MNVPEDRWYTAEHEWVASRPDGNVRIGITDFAQDALGDVVYVDPPEPGRTVKAGESVAEVESTKSVADVYSPIAGVVSAVNAGLTDAPDLINTSPYEDGWILDLTPADSDWQKSLLDAAAYRALTED